MLGNYLDIVAQIQNRFWAQENPSPSLFRSNSKTYAISNYSSPSPLLPSSSNITAPTPATLQSILHKGIRVKF